MGSTLLEAWGKSLLYLCFDQNRLIGLLSIRYELPKELSEKYGDIGYGVRPSERNKGYATAMLRYALSVCKEKGRFFNLQCRINTVKASDAVLRPI